jgi:hypothetical protein
MTRARFANPARLAYAPLEPGAGAPIEVVLARGETTLRFGPEADDVAGSFVGLLL